MVPVEVCNRVDWQNESSNQWASGLMVKALDPSAWDKESLSILVHVVEIMLQRCQCFSKEQ